MKDAYFTISKPLESPIEQRRSFIHRLSDGHVYPITLFFGNFGRGGSHWWYHHPLVIMWEIGRRRKPRKAVSGRDWRMRRCQLISRKIFSTPADLIISGGYFLAVCSTIISEFHGVILFYLLLPVFSLKKSWLDFSPTWLLRQATKFVYG